MKNSAYLRRRPKVVLQTIRPVNMRESFVLDVTLWTVCLERIKIEITWDIEIFIQSIERQNIDPLHVLKPTEEKKPFGCSFCSMYFTCCSSLKRHEIVHTGERPFKCSQCNKTFPRSEHLKKHKSCQKTKKISNVKQIITPITIKTTRNAKMKSTKTLTVYRCPFYLCQFVISKQKFKETTEAVSHLMKKHAIDQNNFANAPKDKLKFFRVNINNSNKL